MRRVATDTRSPCWFVALRRTSGALTAKTTTSHPIMRAPQRAIRPWIALKRAVSKEDVHRSQRAGRTHRRAIPVSLSLSYSLTFAADVTGKDDGKHDSGDRKDIRPLPAGSELRVTRGYVVAGEPAHDAVGCRAVVVEVMRVW